MRRQPERVEALDAMLRQDQRRRRFGEGARCSKCGYPDSEAFQLEGQAVLCYECACLAQGKSPVEQHHILGRANSKETVPMPGNIHRWMSERQGDWAEELQRNVWRDPVLTIASVILAITDFAAWVARHGEQLSDWLLQLRAWLVAQYGSRWWERAGLPGLWLGEARGRSDDDR
jgi:hypothetical protein